MKRLGLPGANAATAFMACAVLLLPVLGIAVALAGPMIGSGSARTYPAIAVNHLATLMWGTIAAMGATYQLWPAMLGVTTRPGNQILAHLAAMVIGGTLLVTGFLMRRPVVIALGGAAVWLAIYAFLATILSVARERRRWPPPATGVILACASLAGTVTWGVLMAENLAHGFWPRLLTYTGVGVHAALGIGGWFVQLIVSVSYYLLPRFVRSNPWSITHGSGILIAVLALLNGGVVALAAAAVLTSAPLARAGALVLSAAGLLYASDLWRILRTAPRDKPDLTIRHWWVIVGQTAGLALLSVGWAAGLPIAGRSLAAAAVVLVLLGWVTLAIMGQVYKVTPFLMWRYRYAMDLAPMDVSRLAAPYHPAEGVAPFVLTAAGSTGMAVAALLGHPALAVAAGLAFLAGTIGFWALMAVSWMRGVLRWRRQS